MKIKNIPPKSSICCENCAFNKGEDKKGVLICEKDGKRRFITLVCDFWKEKRKKT